MHFTPKVNNKILSLLLNKQLIFKLNRIIKQPFNVIFLKNIRSQIYNIKNFLKNSKLNNFEIFYSLKANSSPYLVKKLEYEFLEASSPYETKLALKTNPQKLIINYSGNLKKIIDVFKNYTKTKTKLYLSLNSFEQFLFLINNNLKFDFLIRIGNINNKRFIDLKTTRFGIDQKLIFEIFNVLKKDHFKEKFKGFSFHLDTTSDDLKAEYIKKSVNLIMSALKEGFQIEILDIGGGVRFNYIDKKNWNDLIFLISKKIFHGENNFFWNNYNFGIIKKNKRIFGEGNFFPYYSDNNGFNQIKYWLSTEINGEKLTKILNDLNIRLIFEMGRFILKNAGGSIFEIEQICNSNEKSFLILNGKYNEIAASLDIMYDPVLIKRELIDKNKINKRCYFIFGNTCLEDDIFFKRKICFRNPPQEGDLLYFHNTIPYKTKIFANNFINGNREINLYFDDNYQLIYKEIL